MLAVCLVGQRPHRHSFYQISWKVMLWYAIGPNAIKCHWGAVTDAMKQRFGTIKSPKVLLMQVDGSKQVEGESLKSFVIILR